MEYLLAFKLCYHNSETGVLLSPRYNEAQQDRSWQTDLTHPRSGIPDVRDRLLPSPPGATPGLIPHDVGPKPPQL